MRTLAPFLAAMLFATLAATSLDCSDAPPEVDPDMIPVESRRILRSGARWQELHHFNSDVSHDGRLLAVFGKVWARDISVRDLATGELRTLYEAPEGSSFGGPRFSEDDSRIAFPVRSESGFGLGIGETDGSGFRTVFDSADYDGPLLYMLAVDWIGSDSVLTIVQLQSGGGDSDAAFDALIVSAETGEYESIGSIGFAYLSRFSPDHSMILEGPRDVRLRDRTTGVVTPVAERGWPLGWSPDGRTIYYTTVEGQVFATPGTRIVTGTYRRDLLPDGTLGEPEAIAVPTTSTEPLRYTNERIYSYVDATRPTHRMVSLDLAAGRTLSVPTEITKGLDGRWYGTDPDWSPDGTLVAYTEGPTPNEARIVTRSVGGNNRRDYAFASELGLILPSHLRWHPYDNDLIMLSEGSLSGQSPDDPLPRGHLLRLDLETGRVADIGRVRSTKFAFSGDGNSLYVTGRSGIAAVSPGRFSGPDGTARAEGPACQSDEDPQGFGKAPAAGDCRTIVDWSSGIRREEDEACLDPFQNFALSPEGSTLAVITSRCVGVVPEAGGTVKWVARMDGIQRGGVDWTPDGSEVVFAREITPDGADETRYELVAVHVDTGQKRVLLDLDMIGQPNLSDDGTMLLYRGGTVTVELWEARVME